MSESQRFYDPFAAALKSSDDPEVRLRAWPTGEIVFDVGPGGIWHVSAHGFGRDNPFRWPIRDIHRGPSTLDSIIWAIRTPPRPGEMHLFADSCHLRRERDHQGDWVRFGFPGGVRAWVLSSTLAIALWSLYCEAEWLKDTEELGEPWDGEGPIPQWIEDALAEAKRIREGTLDPPPSS